ncbi:hypothetical protein F4778DRAFT_458454 [Xylariomycetidae sp. FL2044]|nr:hypothetical protein F4778DRAFT_458454 [Xylariomycetidae sp. FL2044]
MSTYFVTRTESRLHVTSFVNNRPTVWATSEYQCHKPQQTRLLGARVGCISLPFNVDFQPSTLTVWPGVVRYSRLFVQFPVTDDIITLVNERGDTYLPRSPCYHRSINPVTVGQLSAISGPQVIRTLIPVSRTRARLQRKTSHSLSARSGFAVVARGRISRYLRSCVPNSTEGAPPCSAAMNYPLLSSLTMTVVSGTFEEEHKLNT